MGKLTTIPATYDRMSRDIPRHKLPPGVAYDIVDMLPSVGSSLRERGGWSNASNSISAVTSTASQAKAGAYVTFGTSSTTAQGAGETLLVLDEDGLLFEISLDGTVTAKGAARIPKQNPTFMGGAPASAATAQYEGLLIMTDATGQDIPKKYNGTAISDLGGNPPKALFSAAYQNYLVLGNGTAESLSHPNRIWFSPPGDPDCAVSSVTAWDVTDSWIDFSLPIFGLAATNNALLVFHKWGAISRVTGSIPPPDADMRVDDPWLTIGVLDPMSITTYGEMAYWAGPEGVFGSDGVALDDLTAKGGMSRYWSDLVYNADRQWHIATGVIRNSLIVTVSNSANAFVDAFAIDLSSYAWTRLKNLPASSLWSGFTSARDELFMGRLDAARVARLSTMWDADSATYKADGDGTAVAGSIELPFFEFTEPGIKTVKSVYVGQYLKDYASDNPSVAVSYVNTPEETNYTAIGSLTENSEYTRQRLSLGGRHYGIGLKLAKTGAGDWQLQDVSFEQSPQEVTKR